MTSRSPKQGAASCLCPSPVPSFGELDQSSLASLDALEVMSECDAPMGFTRGSRSRASLPVVRSANQTKDRSLGVLYLQYGDDMKQIRMPNEITSADTIRALFVSAFPQQLNMKMLESPSTAIYVKDDMRNMYYELSDVRSITDQACLKVYHKDPAHAFSHGARASNGDTRCEPAFICEKHRAPVANLPILVFSGKCQASCTVLGCEHNPHLWTSGPHTILMESVSNRLCRHMHICSLLEVILQSSGNAPSVPPCTKAEVAVLLLGCCPPTASSMSPGVLACLLVVPAGSGYYADTANLLATARLDVPSWMSCTT
ncbi:hypothetical protein NFI96_001232 [Prochilodus magdalenae]|nr:hypothetical protein NFI96_001232 [Prochilodus magdalenae]